MADELELVLTDEAGLLPLTHALRAGWVTAPGPVRWLAPVAAEAALSNHTLALVAPLAYARVAASHAVVSSVAVAGRLRGAAALAAARRPDELVDVEIDARDVTGTTEALARVLAAQHFGAEGWRITRQPAPGAPARLLEGDPALVALAEAAAAQAEQERHRAPAGAPDEEPEAEAGEAPAGPHTEDLGRAWFVLTGLPWVSHVLLVPRAAAVTHPDAIIAAVAALRESLRRGREQEATVVAEAAARLGIPTGPIRDLFRTRTYALGDEEKQSLASFFRRAGSHAGLSPVPEIAVLPVET